MLYWLNQERPWTMQLATVRRDVKMAGVVGRPVVGHACCNLTISWCSFNVVSPLYERFLLHPSSHFI